MHEGNQLNMLTFVALIASSLQLGLNFHFQIMIFLFTWNDFLPKFIQFF